MFYKMFMKIKEKEYEIQIEDITDKVPVGIESYSKAFVPKMGKSKKVNDENKIREN